MPPAEPLEEGPLALIAASRDGALLAARLARDWPQLQIYVLDRYLGSGGPNARPLAAPLRAAVGELFRSCRGLVFLLPVGAVVRLIAPHLDDKRTDPAVVAVDDGGRFAVSVLSGHAGGANALAGRIAVELGAMPVITTAVERRGFPAPELIGEPFGWRLEASREALLRASAALANGQPIAVYRDTGEPEWVPREMPIRRFRRLAMLARSDAEAAIVVTVSQLPERVRDRYVVWRPRRLIAGIGCSSGCSADEMEELLRSGLDEAECAIGSIGSLVTIDRKLREPGLVELATRLGVKLKGFSSKQLAAVAVPNPSLAVWQAVGTPSVAEAAALRAANAPALVLPKRTSPKATVALARRSTAVKRDFPSWWQAPFEPRPVV